MRILHSPSLYASPLPETTPGVPAPSAPAPNLEPLLERIQSLEERLRALEQALTAGQPKTPTAKLAAISIDPEAFKKTLLTKMWKYLHDERSAKAI